MIERLIKTSQGNDYWIRSDDPEVAEWINYGENNIDIILRQINDEQIYGPIFQGRSNMKIVDFGANVGMFSLYAADSAEQIYAIEPTPRTFNMLTKLTKDVPNITRLESALSFSDDPVTFFINENPTVNSLLDRHGEPTVVNGITIESFLKKYELTNVDFAKCDIEGSEVDVLTEASLDPVRDIVKFWFIEVHQTDVKQRPWPGNLGNNRDQIESIMRNMGYSTEQVINDQLFAWR